MNSLKLIFNINRIILQSAFILNNQYFFENLITILMYAIVVSILQKIEIWNCSVTFNNFGFDIKGTLINTFLIGISLYFVSLVIWEQYFPRISFLEILIFANAISAVDPVTVRQAMRLCFAQNYPQSVSRF